MSEARRTNSVVVAVVLEGLSSVVATAGSPCSVVGCAPWRTHTSIWRTGRACPGWWLTGRAGSRLSQFVCGELYDGWAPRCLTIVSTGRQNRVGYPAPWRFLSIF